MNRTSSARRRAQQMRRGSARGGRRTAAQAESRALARLTICGVVFVLLVAVKLLFPEAVSGFARSAGQLIGRNADFKEAFAAMGRAVSGQAAVSDSLQDAYTAVFSPSPPLEEESAAPSRTKASLDPGARLLRYTAVRLPEAEAEPMAEIVVDLDGAPAPQLPPEEPAGEPEPPAAPAAETEEEDDTTAAEAVSYVYTMPAMPDNASLEQRNLGFAHTSPIRGALSSAFGWREHPIEGGNKFHYGVDLAADQGTDILAFADGEVYATGESSTLGNYIMLQHQGGYITLYAHCSRVTAAGGAVVKGEKIAEVGDTGLDRKSVV